MGKIFIGTIGPVRIYGMKDEDEALQFMIERIANSDFRIEIEEEKEEEDAPRRNGIPKELWVCRDCGNSTWNIEYDYLMSHDLCLKCALVQNNLQFREGKANYEKCNKK